MRAEARREFAVVDPVTIGLFARRHVERAEDEIENRKSGGEVLFTAAVGCGVMPAVEPVSYTHLLSGKPQNPVSQLLSTAQLTFTVTRGPLNVSGRADALVITTPLSGTFEALGTLTGGIGGAAGAVGNIIGGSVGQQVQSLAGKAFDQHADIRGTVTATSRPTIAPNWRLSPNLTAQVSVVDVVLPIGGIKLSVSNEVKPVLDNLVREQANALETRVRNDPFIELAAKSEWVKLLSLIHI